MANDVHNLHVINSAAVGNDEVFHIVAECFVGLDLRASVSLGLLVELEGEFLVAIVVVGDGNGVIGYGLGKAGEVTAAIAKGTEAAKKNLVKVPILKGTVPHEVETAFGGAKVLIKPAAAGTGLKAGGAMRAVLESVGIKDVIAKSKGSSNAHNLVKATIAALAEMRDAYTVAGERGISMDKVFNG